MGDMTIRLRSVTPLSVNGENRLGMGVSEWFGGTWGSAVRVVGDRLGFQLTSEVHQRGYGALSSRKELLTAMRASR
ncbi:hypothetical protein GCM10009619_27270 [Williamsia maris]